MSRSYDIVIIGAGITGSMLAMKLSKYKLGIAVVEATLRPRRGRDESELGDSPRGLRRPARNAQGKAQRARLRGASRDRETARRPV